MFVKMTSKRKFEDHMPKLTWAISAETTYEILSDIGVGLLESDNSNSMNSPYQPPTVKTSNTRISFPRITQGPKGTCKRDAIKELTDPVHMPSDGFKLFKRRRPEGPRGKDYFANVSDEVMLKIFQWLPKSTLGKCSAVCQRFHRLTNDESLWRRLDLGGKHLSAAVLLCIIEKGLLALRLAKAEICEPPIQNSPDSYQFQTWPKCCRLQFLDLSMATVAEPILEAILKHCKQLRRLSLENCKLSDAICCCVAANPDLTHLNLAMCQQLSTQGIITIAQGCQKTESLNLAWTSLTEDGLTGAMTNIPSTLKRINISGCRNSLTDEHIEKLAQRCPNLLELDVSDACQLTDEVLQIVVYYLPQLKRLAVSRCYHIRAVAYIALQQLPDLISLEIFGVLPPNVIETLKLSLPRVEINTYFFSTVARPTTGIRRTSIWGLRVRD